jgi:ankyrin repeat protein
MGRIMFQSLSISLLFLPMLACASSSSSSSNSSSSISIVRAPPLKVMSDKKRGKLNDRLKEASYGGNWRDAEKALSNGADPNCVNKFGFTPLHNAAHRKSIRLMHALLSKGALVNVGDDEGLTPLFHATYGGSLDAIKLLLAHNADIHARTKKGLSFITYIQKAELLEKVIDLPACNFLLFADPFQMHLFETACIFDNFHTMKKLLEYGFEVNERFTREEPKGHMPLH